MSTTPKSSPATRASGKRRLSEGSLKIEFKTPNKKARRQSAPLNGSKLSAGAYKDHTCPSCNQDLRHRKLSKVNFQKHVDKCEKVYPFIVNDNECKFCGKTGRVGYIGNHILETHSPQMNGEEETLENRGVPDGQDKTPEPNAVKMNNKRKSFQTKIEPATPIKFDATISDEANESKSKIAPTPSVKIDCKFCHSNFAKGNIGKHEETCQKYHKYVKDLKCTFCDKGFGSQNYAYQHLTKVHSSEIDGNSQKNDERNVEDNQDDESDDSKESESESEDESEKEANELVIDESCKDDSGESDDEENDKDEMNENLNENPDESPDEGPWAQCSHCARFIPDHKMQDHQKNCGEKKSEPIVEETEQIEDDDDEEPNSDENGQDLTTEEDGDNSGIITLDRDDSDEDEDEEMLVECKKETPQDTASQNSQVLTSQGSQEVSSQGSICSYCYDEIRDDDKLDHLLVCQENSMYIDEETKSCRICDVDFDSIRRVYKHILRDHKRTKKSSNEAQQNPIVTMPDEEPPNKNQIKNEFVHGNYPLVKHAVQLKQEAFEREDFKNVPEDPNCIEQLHVCPVCEKYLPTAMMAMDHIGKGFHKISPENQARLNLKIRRIDLESLSL